MTANVNSSIKVFLSELRNRINLLSSDKVTENIDNANIDKINNILSNYNIASNENITIEEIKRVSLSDIKSLLYLIGQNEDSIEYLVSKIDEHYEKITSSINKYISDFISIGKNQTDMINDKINLYQKYINLFEKEDLDEPFEELNEICKVISEVGMSDEDKWKILEYIAVTNNKTIKEIDINLSVRVSKELSNIMTYLEDKEIESTIEKRLSNNEIDIDTIPIIGSELSETTGLDKDIMVNIVATLIASNLLKQASKINNEEEQSELIDVIYSVLEYINVLDSPCVYEAREVKNKTYDYYNNSIASGITEDMIKEYLETPLSLLESKDISREYAIDLKELSVLKPIYETLDTIAHLDKTGEDYKKATTVLSKLLEQYNLLENKKNNLEKRIN